MRIITIMIIIMIIIIMIITIVIIIMIITIIIIEYQCKINVSDVELKDS